MKFSSATLLLTLQLSLKGPHCSASSVRTRKSSPRNLIYNAELKLKPHDDETKAHMIGSKTRASFTTTNLMTTTSVASPMVFSTTSAAEETGPMAMTTSAVSPMAFTTTAVEEEGPMIATTSAEDESEMMFTTTAVSPTAFSTTSVEEAGPMITTTSAVSPVVFATNEEDDGPVLVEDITPAESSCAMDWTDFIVKDHSPENDEGEVTCPHSNDVVTGLHCMDHYCDDIRLLCRTCPSCIYTETESYWTETVSEETEETMMCDENFFMTGLSCNGHYCDNLKMHCTESFGRTADDTDCVWSEWISEEDDDGIIFKNDGPLEVAPRGMECRGHYCDDKRFLLCPVVESC